MTRSGPGSPARPGSADFTPDRTRRPPVSLKFVASSAVIALLVTLGVKHYEAQKG